MEKYDNLTDEQIALICAKDIVVEEIRRGWDFSDESPATITMRIAYRFNSFLNTPDIECDT